MDVSFTITDVLKAYACQAMRRAVFYPVLGAGWEAEGVEWALDQVRDRWRARLVALRDAGWLAVADLRDFQYLRNCPPFGVKARQRTRPCKRPLVCPFCWARRVVEPAYQTLAAGLDRDDDAWVVEVLADYHLGRHGLEPCRELIGARTARGRDLEGADYRTAVVAHRVGLTRDPPGVELRRATLYVSPREVEAEPDRVWTRKATRKAIVRAVAHALPYPAGMMTSPPRAAVLTLEALKGARMLSHRDVPSYRKRDHELGARSPRSPRPSRGS